MTEYSVQKPNSQPDRLSAKRLCLSYSITCISHSNNNTKSWNKTLLLDLSNCVYSTSKCPLLLAGVTTCYHGEIWLSISPGSQWKQRYPPNSQTNLVSDYLDLLLESFWFLLHTRNTLTCSGVQLHVLFHNKKTVKTHHLTVLTMSESFGPVVLYFCSVVEVIHGVGQDVLGHLQTQSHIWFINYSI